MPKICANNKVIVHSQWQRVEDATSIVNALTAIANSQTRGVGGGYPAPLLLRAGEEDECMNERKRDADWVNNGGGAQTHGGGVYRAKVL